MADPADASTAAVLRELLGLNDDEPGTLEDEFGPGDFPWQEAVVDVIEADMKSVADQLGLDKNYLTGWLAANQLEMLRYLETTLDPTARIGMGAINPTGAGGLAELINRARSWVGWYFPGFRDAVLLDKPTSGPGRRGPSAADIRASFDLDQLTSTVNQMAQALILDTMPNASAVAKSYIDAIVANPSQNLDFETFARDRILETARAKTIYKNKPDAITEEQFLQPYVQAFMQRAGPGFGDQLATTATAGARLGASPDAFQARLDRTRQVQTGAPFLANLGRRLSNFGQVLR